MYVEGHMLQVASQEVMSRALVQCESTSFNTKPNMQSRANLRRFEANTGFAF